MTDKKSKKLNKKGVFNLITKIKTKIKDNNADDKNIIKKSKNNQIKKSKKKTITIPKKQINIGRKSGKNLINKEQNKEYEINLSLGSGMARGYAHIPIIQTLLKKNIKIKEVAGSSAGSIIGAYYALYGEVGSLEVFLKTMSKGDFIRLIHFNNPKYSITKTDRIKEMFIKLFKDKTFNDTKIPLVICATKINTNEPVYIRSGKIVDAIMASIAVPVIFPAYEYNKSYYVDGGITDPLPIKCFKNKKRKIIAVDLYRLNKGHIKEYTAINIAILSYYIMEEQITEKTIYNKNKVFILKPDFGKGNLDAIDFSDYNRFNTPGKNIIKKNINKIMKWLD